MILRDNFFEEFHNKTKIQIVSRLLAEIAKPVTLPEIPAQKDIFQKLATKAETEAMKRFFEGFADDDDDMSNEQLQNIMADEVEVRYLLMLQAAVGCAWDSFAARMQAVRDAGDVERLVECWHTLFSIDFDVKYQRRFNKILFGKEEIDDEEVEQRRLSARAAAKKQKEVDV